MKGENDMIYYTADLHLNHKNILHLSQRPFADINEMKRTIRDYWNQTVTEQDEVYILGDICLSFNAETENYMHSLHGRKHLIIGNHDKKFLKMERFRNLFVSVQNYLEIEDENRNVVLFHYPILEWDGYYKGWYHVYGHVHNNINETTALLQQEHFVNAFNAGIDVNAFTPVTLSQMIQKKQA